MNIPIQSRGGTNTPPPTFKIGIKFLKKIDVGMFISFIQGDIARTHF
jgi:hypothetical protein